MEKEFVLIGSYAKYNDIINGAEGKAIIEELKKGEIKKYSIKSISGNLYCFINNYADMKPILEKVENEFYKDKSNDALNDLKINATVELEEKLKKELEDLKTELENIKGEHQKLLTEQQEWYDELSRQSLENEFLKQEKEKQVETIVEIQKLIDTQSEYINKLNVEMFELNNEIFTLKNKKPTLEQVVAFVRENKGYEIIITSVE